MKKTLRLMSPLLQRYPPHFAGLPRVLQVVWMHHKLSGPQPDDAHALNLHLGGGPQHLRSALRRLIHHGYLIHEDGNLQGANRACKPEEYTDIIPYTHVRQTRGLR